jgi:hypothetical protein
MLARRMIADTSDPRCVPLPVCVPAGVKLRALFMVINTFAHACGVEKMMRPGAAAGVCARPLALVCMRAGGRRLACWLVDGRVLANDGGRSTMQTRSRQLST